LKNNEQLSLTVGKWFFRTLVKMSHSLEQVEVEGSKVDPNQ
jgi:hypothetical protein